MTEALLWVAMAGLTAAAVLAVIAPLMRPRAPAVVPGSDAAVYRDQLSQLDRERAEGLLSEQDGQAARAEIGRRLLRATASEPERPGAPSRDRTFLARGLMLLIPVVAVGLYLTLGSPDLPGQPLAARLSAPPDPNDVEGLLARAELELQRHPEQVEGWALMAPLYMRLGRYADAANAYSALIRLGGATAERETMRGVALVGLAGGVVTADARTAFDRALALDPSYVQARISRALAIETEGDRAGALAELHAVLKGLPADAPLRPALQREIARMEGMPGPTGDQVAAAASMSGEQQSAMVSGMVEGLSARLAGQGGTIEEWLRLVRSYKVLGETDKARAAADTARKAYGADPTALARIDALVQSLGLGS